MMKRSLLCAALAAALAAAGCGGGGSDSSATTPEQPPTTPTPSTPPPTTPAPSTPPPLVPTPPTAPTNPTPPPTTTPTTPTSPTSPTTPGTIDRIEPLDTATLKSGAQAKAESVAARSRMPQGAAAARIALGPLVAAKMAAPQNKGAPLRVGQGRAVQATASPQDLAGQLRWNALADGSQVAAVAFSSDGAQAMRLGVLARRVPAGAVLRFYGADGADVVEMTAAQLDELRRNNEAGGLSGDDARLVWGPTTAGSVSVLEVQLPPGADAGQLQLAVPQLSHFAQTMQQTLKDAVDTYGLGSSASCNLDVMCNTDLQAESRAVAKIVFHSGNSDYLCTGTLMNDAKGSRTPYFLTANHCISTQAEASSVETNWFFRAASCNSSPLYSAAATRITGGARLLYTEATSDATLLQLNAAPPANVVYAGSYFGAGLVLSTSVAGVHHPQGDLQKYSLGNVIGYDICVASGGGMSSCRSATLSTGTMYQIGWAQGVTEPGSSGSALFTKLGNTRYVAGTLNAGDASCTNRSGVDDYGRFDGAYSRGIKTYLNP